MFDLILRQRHNVKNDLLSGLTVAFALVPEAVAFAFVAGVDPAVGLWAAFFVGIITASIGGRPGMISGATGAMAVVMTSFVILYGLEYLLAAVILCGVIQILCGLFKLGKFVRLLPHPVMLGFVNGLAIVIFRSQFGQLKGDHHVVYNNATQTFEVAAQWISGNSLYTAIGILIVTMSIIYFLPKVTKVIPATLVAILLTTSVIQLSPIETVTVKDFVDTQSKLALEKNFKTKEFHKIKDELRLSDVDSIGSIIAEAKDQVYEQNETRKAGRFGVPKISLSWKDFEIIFGLAITLAAIGLIESLMTLTLIDELTGSRGKSNRECVGQGIANMVSGFFGSMGGCAMIGQSMINISSGGRGRLSGISAALFLFCFIIFPPLWKFIEMIPIASLIGVMFIVVIGTFEWTSLRLWNKIPKSDFMIIAIVSAVTVTHDLAIAVTIGVIISALVFAWKKSQRISAEIKESNGVKTYILDGSLFFGSVTSFKNLFTPSQDPKNVVIEFQNTRVYDHSALEAINTISEKYKELGKILRLKHLSKECQTLIKKANSIIEIDTHHDPDYHIATDELD
ncbi:MAG: SulP family inorganic anion transporter [Candidatus Scalindua sp. AMX11]|nr:MAG: SulP family inorganic anion transporter [Candidatus Scalindua sp.]NOG82814.1 SulP family inorganic anion transporter [Planctomycetota bacterium]RZV69040.1 MAG: SulP family inorganic anion transporter [Candidatus Scalindua sp. SCAELEC01]TDE63872.1 MAG: SulP family inorganic anion transporter [Candidatus Scalindua sp. AMX11]GJQ60413.1 MAG: sodium-independent anion transporter [Candidatus Scalindua sp.]